MSDQPESKNSKERDLDVRREYDVYAKDAERTLDYIRPRLADYLEETLGWKVFAITKRTKKVDSAVKKLAKFGSLANLPDFACLRVVVYSPRDLDMALHFFTEGHEIPTDAWDDRTEDPAIPDGREFRILGARDIQNDGYSAKHVRLVRQSAQYKSPRKVRLEVQIRTIFQDASAELSHRFFYKFTTTKPDPRLLERLAALVGEVDDVVQQILNHVTEFAENQPKGELNVASFQRICREIAGEDIADEVAVQEIVWWRVRGVKWNWELESLLRDSEVEQMVAELERRNSTQAGRMGRASMFSMFAALRGTDARRQFLDAMVRLT